MSLVLDIIELKNNMISTLNESVYLVNQMNDINLYNESVNEMVILNESISSLHEQIVELYLSNNIQNL